MSAAAYSVTLDLSAEDVRNLRRELLQVMVVVPTISGLIEAIESATGVSARSTVIGDLS